MTLSLMELLVTAKKTFFNRGGFEFEKIIPDETNSMLPVTLS